MLRHTCMCLFSKCCKCFKCFKNKHNNISNINHSREINTPIIPHNINNTNNTNNIINIHIINNDSEDESITESITESLPESLPESIQQNIIIFNTNTIIKSDDIRIPEPINDIPIYTNEINTPINTPINTHYNNQSNIQQVEHIEHKDDINDNEEQYTIIHTNTQQDTTPPDSGLTIVDFYNISMNDDYEYSSDTEEYIKVLESIKIPYTQ